MHDQVEGQLVRRAGCELVIELQEIARMGEVDQTRHHASERVQGELERRDHAEVAASAAQAPEQIWVLVGRRAHALTGGCHQLGADQ